MIDSEEANYQGIQNKANLVDGLRVHSNRILLYLNLTKLSNLIVGTQNSPFSYFNSPGTTVIICFLPSLKILIVDLLPITPSFKYLCRLSTVATGLYSNSTIISPTLNWLLKASISAKMSKTYTPVFVFN